MMDNVALGRRLRARRIAAGLSLRKLSLRVPVSAQALSQYEHGRAQPRSEVLEVLADVLGTRVEELSRVQDGDWLRLVPVRQPRNRRQKTLRKAQESLVAMTERSLVLEQKLGGGFSSPSLPVMENIRLIRDPEDAEWLAQDVRHRWGLGTGPLPKLVSLFEARGVRVFELLHDKDSREFIVCSASVSFSGASWLEIPVILVNGALSGERKRFALCHELSHMILASPLRHVLSPEVQEKRSNWFAGALLLPATALRDQLGRKRRSVSWYELREVKRQFGISYFRIVFRCREAGIISRDVFRHLLEQYRQRGWAEKPGCEDSALSPTEESSTRLRRLAIRAVTEGIMTPQEAAALLSMQQEEFDILVGTSESVIGRNSLRIGGEQPRGRAASL